VERLCEIYGVTSEDLETFGERWEDE
jgi:hypothetical protein